MCVHLWRRRGHHVYFEVGWGIIWYKFMSVLRQLYKSYWVCFRKIHIYIDWDFPGEWFSKK
jgi:hypothetical protein